MIEITFYVIYTDGTKHEENIPYNSMKEANDEIKIFMKDNDPFLEVTNFNKTIMAMGVVKPFEEVL